MTARAVVNPKNPTQIALCYLSQEHTTGETRTLHRQSRDWLEWTGTHYHLVEDDEIRSRLWDWLATRCYVVGGETPKRLIPRASLVTEVVDALSGKCHLSHEIQEPCWLCDGREQDPSKLVPAMNGILDPMSGEVLPHDPAMLSLGCVPCEWDEAARSPRWEQFLEELWPDDEESRATLQEYVGYLLTPDVSQHKMLGVFGPRRCGKGTIGRVLTQLIGKRHTVACSLGDLGETFGMWPLLGARLAIVGEAIVSQRADRIRIVERLLGITGEDGQSVNRKSKSFVQKTLRCRFYLMANKVPQLEDTSHALASRLLTLSIKPSFEGREDRALTDTLIGELQGILTWAVEGLRRLRTRGEFVQPESGLGHLEVMKEMGDPVGTFLDERCERSDFRWVRWDLLWNAWVEWGDENGVDRGVRSVLSSEIKAKWPEVGTKPKRIGEKVLRVLHGVVLQTSESTAWHEGEGAA